MNEKFRWISANIAQAANRGPALVYSEIMALVKTEVDTQGYTSSLLFGGDGYSGRKSKGAARIEDTHAVVKRVEKLEKERHRDPSPRRRSPVKDRSPDRRSSSSKKKNKGKGHQKKSDLVDRASPRARDEGKKEEYCPKFNRGECSRTSCRLGAHKCNKRVSDPRGGLRPCGKGHPGVDHR